jgi:hypothetical protein
MIAIRLLVALVVSAVCFASDSSEQSRLVLFLDTTASLNDQQNAATVELAKKLLHGGREYDSVAVYPVGSANEAPAPVLDETVRERITERRRQLQRWDSQLDNVVRNHNKEAHTCLLDAFEFASKQLRTLQASQDSRIDLVFVTDMIEDCVSTPLDLPIHLNKPVIRREIDLARQFPVRRIDLASAHVYIIVPPNTKARTSGPRIDELENFWRSFLSRCAVKPDEVTVSISRVPPQLIDD